MKRVSDCLTLECRFTEKSCNSQFTLWALNAFHEHTSRVMIPHLDGLESAIYVDEMGYGALVLSMVD